MFDVNLFAKRIHYFRTERNFTLEKLSEMADITPNYLSEIEHGKHTPTIETAISLLNALNINFSILLDGHDNESALNNAIFLNSQNLSDDEINFMKNILSGLER